MILSSHGIVASQIASFDADAVAFFNRVTTAGGSLTNTEKQAVNQLVLDLKSYSIWANMKAIYPMVGASAAACAQNLKSASFTGVFNGGVTFASTGVTGNGTNGYMDTGFNSSVSGNLNDGFVAVYLRTNLNGNPSCDIGNYNGSSSAITIYSRVNGVQLARYNDVTDTQAPSTTDSSGFRYCNRQNSSSKKVGINTTITSVSSNADVLINRNIVLFALNNNGTINQFSTRQQAFACIGDGLTDTNASDFYTAVQAFQTTLSRQV